MLTFNRMQNSVVQGLPAWVIGGGADACSTAVGQSVSDGLKQERAAKVILTSITLSSSDLTYYYCEYCYSCYDYYNYYLQQ